MRANGKWDAVFLQLNPSNNGDYESLILLKEDKDIPKQGEWYDGGMTRLCIFTQKLDEQVEELKENFDINPMGPVTFKSKGKS